MELNERTAADLAAAIADGAATSEQAVAACLARIEAREDTVGAWAHLAPDLALAQARDRDRAQAASGPLGPLHGVPVGIKDIIDTADLPTENGSDLFRGRRPVHAATCLALLRAAGAVIIGKTV
ncbi:MAG: amidase family protein, partial [Magnetovibrio sp.]|nr:amidase family protein [Magnetovibrio sp.]